jgi:hypothetical protein
MPRKNTTRRKPITGQLIQFPGGAYVPRSRLAKPKADTDDSIDLNEMLLKHPGSTLLFTMTKANSEAILMRGDKLIVDCSVTPRFRDLVAIIDEDGGYRIVPLRDIDDEEIIGVVHAVIRIL